MYGESKEFARVIDCDYCKRNCYPRILLDKSFNLPHPGYIGANYENTRVLLAGQNPGESPERFKSQDTQFAKAKVTLRKNPNDYNAVELKRIQDKIMPTWDVFNNYFPLKLCGLQLDDIAYTNVVRCRTKKNAPPGVRIANACISRHFVRWLDWLKPCVVVCIGKYAHDKISDELEIRKIPNGFINRDRSLSAFERQENRKEVASLVRGVLRAT